MVYPLTAATSYYTDKLYQIRAEIAQLRREIGEHRSAYSALASVAGLADWIFGSNDSGWVSDQFRPKHEKLVSRLEELERDERYYAPLAEKEAYQLAQANANKARMEEEAEEHKRQEEERKRQKEEERKRQEEELKGKLEKRRCDMEEAIRTGEFKPGTTVSGKYAGEWRRLTSPQGITYNALKIEIVFSSEKVVDANWEWWLPLGEIVNKNRVGIEYKKLAGHYPKSFDAVEPLYKGHVITAKVKGEIVDVCTQMQLEDGHRVREDSPGMLLEHGFVEGFGEEHHDTSNRMLERRPAQGREREEADTAMPSAGDKLWFNGGENAFSQTRVEIFRAFLIEAGIKEMADVAKVALRFSKRFGVKLTALFGGLKAKEVAQNEEGMRFCEWRQSLTPPFLSVRPKLATDRVINTAGEWAARVKRLAAQNPPEKILFGKLAEYAGVSIESVYIAYMDAVRKIVGAGAGARRKEDVRIGDELDGTVGFIKTDFAIVDFGCFNGLLHISEISTDYVENISDHLKLGQWVHVRVVGIDEKGLKLSMKNGAEDVRRKSGMAGMRKTEPILDVQESKTVEFKSSIMYSPKTSRPDREQFHKIANTICAFLNTDGGDLYIGVDDQTGRVIGIERDYAVLNDVPVVAENGKEIDVSYKSSRDGFEQKLTDILVYMLGKEMAAKAELEYFTVEGRQYVKVHVDRLPKPDVAYVYERDVFQRFNATTRILKGKERDRFMMGRMERNKDNEEENKKSRPQKKNLKMQAPWEEKRRRREEECCDDYDYDDEEEEEYERRRREEEEDNERRRREEDERRREEEEEERRREEEEER